MKIKYKFIYIIGMLAITTACSDFLDKYPLDQQTEATAFVTNDNFKSYAWGLYDYFSGFPANGDYYPNNIYYSECYTDNMIRSQAGYESAYAYQLKTVPTTSSSRWSDRFEYVRQVNIMLDNIDGSSMTDTDKNHWRSVGYFFRALYYYDLVADYGDITWVGHAASDADEDILYGERTPRATVTQNMMDDLLYAEEHIKENGDGVNTINVNVVRALISRFGLFEGTWRKYHGLAGSETYLQASANASAKLITSFPAVMSKYDDVYNSDDLAGKTGVLLAKQYATDQTTHSITRVVRTSAWYADLTKDAIESYLCTDGKPIATSSVYEGDGNIYSEFRNRDRRLYYTVIPPYEVKLLGAAGTSVTWEHVTDPAKREYIDLMNSLSAATAKYLPVSNYAAYTVAAVPHFKNYPNGQGFIVSETGYYFWKYYNRHVDNMALRTSTVDFLLFGMEEVMLNYAEAMFELGAFDQGIADATINILRARANVANMTVSAINASFDPARDQTVDPVLWEIRRERRVELMGDGFRFLDLKRWKKGAYVNRQPLGVKAKNSDYGNKLKILDGASEGNVVFFGVPPGWLEHYYLEPIPKQELVLNPSLKQNPGWDE